MHVHHSNPRVLPGAVLVVVTRSKTDLVLLDQGGGGPQRDQIPDTDGAVISVDPLPPN